MSLRIYVYNEAGIIADTADPSQFSVYKEEARNKGYKYIEADSFPPAGFTFSAGQLSPKSEGDRVIAGEIKLSDLIRSKQDLIRSICATKITSGITSSALGSPYMYDSEEIDQQNLIAKVATGKDSYYKCTNLATGIKTYVMHTTAQFKKALQDGDERITALLINSEKLRNTLSGVVTYEGVKNFNVNIGWDD